MNGGQREQESFWLRLLLRILRPPDPDERESIWAVSRKWLPFFIAMVSVAVAVWMWVIAGMVIESGEYSDTTEVTVTIVDRASSAVPLIVLIGVCVTYWLDVLGGMFMVTSRYLSSKFVTPIVERYLAEGRAEGRAEAHEMWADWYRRFKEAEVKGIPFDEPPPELPSDLGRNGS